MSKEKIIKWLGGYTKKDLQEKREDLFNLMSVELLQNLRPQFLDTLNRLDTYFKLNDIETNQYLKDKIKCEILQFIKYYI